LREVVILPFLVPTAVHDPFNELLKRHRTHALEIGQYIIGKLAQVPVVGCRREGIGIFGVETHPHVFKQYGVDRNVELLSVTR
jgi:hypothetical protein